MVAKAYLGKIVFVYLEFADESIAKIKAYFEIKDEMLPMTVIYDVSFL